MKISLYLSLVGQRRTHQSVCDYYSEAASREYYQNKNEAVRQPKGWASSRFVFNISVVHV